MTPKRFAVRGFVSRPQVQKNNRNSIFVFVNGRLIRDRLMLHALSAAYHNLMPRGLLSVCAAVSRLRLRRSGCQCASFEDGSPVPASIVGTRFCARCGAGSADAVAARAEFQSESATRRDAALFRFFADDAERFGGAGVCAASGAPRPARFDFGDARHRCANRSPPYSRLQRAAKAARSGYAWRISDGCHADGKLHGANRRSASAGPVAPQLHHCGGRDGLWIIDQHVAHERILFEQVLAQQASGRAEMQQLLMPVILQLTPEQQIEYARIEDELRASGFDTEPFGNRTIAVKAVPAAMGHADIERVIFEILEIAEEELRGVSAGGSAARHRGIDRLPGGDQDQHSARSQEDGMDAARAGGYGVSDGLSAWPAGALQYGMREILRAFHRI